jgi:lambda repressor-like predicted transcriptional regulator
MQAPIIAKKTGLSPTTFKDTLAERSRPYPKNKELLAAIVRKTWPGLKPLSGPA